MIKKLTSNKSHKNRRNHSGKTQMFRLLLKCWHNLITQLVPIERVSAIGTLELIKMFQNKNL